MAMLGVSGAIISGIQMYPLASKIRREKT